VLEVALAKSGSCSMDSLARGWFTQGCAASDGRGFTLGSAERALQARREEGAIEQNPNARNGAGRAACGPEGWAWAWVLVDCSGRRGGNGLRGAGFGLTDGREVASAVGLVGISRDLRVAVMTRDGGVDCGLNGESEASRRVVSSFS
jgi:hypothetical protein